MTDMELAEEIERRWRLWNGQDWREADLRQLLFSTCRQIIAALRRGPEHPPLGEMVMVPREPTEAMRFAGNVEQSRQEHTNMRSASAIYLAMLSAAEASKEAK